MRRSRVQTRRVVVWWLMMSFTFLVGMSHVARAKEKAGPSSATVQERAPGIEPRRAEVKLGPSSANVRQLPGIGPQRSKEKLDLNAATVQELMKLPGIGPKRAEEIIRYRLRHNGLKRPADLLRIKGIGRRTYFKLKPLVRVERIGPRKIEEGGAPTTRSR